MNMLDLSMFVVLYKYKAIQYGGTGMNRFTIQTRQAKQTRHTTRHTVTQEQEHDLLQHMTRADLQQMRSIYKAIQAEKVSTGELIWLQDHKQEVLATNDPTLCEWAGITEQEYSNGKLEE